MDENLLGNQVLKGVRVNSFNLNYHNQLSLISHKTTNRPPFGYHQQRRENKTENAKQEKRH